MVKSTHNLSKSHSTWPPIWMKTRVKLLQYGIPVYDRKIVRNLSVWRLDLSVEHVRKLDGVRRCPLKVLCGFRLETHLAAFGLAHRFTGSGHQRTLTSFEHWSGRSWRHTKPSPLTPHRMAAINRKLQTTQHTGTKGATWSQLRTDRQPWWGRCGTGVFTIYSLTIWRLGGVWGLASNTGRRLDATGSRRIGRSMVKARMREMSLLVRGWSPKGWA